MIRKLTALGISKSTRCRQTHPRCTGLNFATTISQSSKFADLRPGVKTLETEFKKRESPGAGKSKALVAVFGSGYPVDPETGQAVPTGFTGIENIHMNQGEET